MKRIARIVLALLVTCLFLGCDKTAAPTSSKPTPGTEKQQQTAAPTSGKPTPGAEKDKQAEKAPPSWADFKPVERGTLDVPRNLDSLDVSRDASLVAAGTSYGTENQVHLLETAGAKKLPLKIEGDLSNKIALSPDGKILALAVRSKDKTSGAVQSTVKLWDIAGAKEVQSFSAPSYTRQMTFSRDGSTLAVACEDNLIRLWDRVLGKEKIALKGSKELCGALAFAPDGKLLASGDNKSVRLWDVAAGKERATLPGHNDFVSWLAFTPDAKTLLSRSTDGTVKVWDVDAAKERNSLNQGLRSGGTALTPDGTALITGSFLEIKVTDVATGKALTEWKAFDGPESIAEILFSQDGKTLLVGTSDGKIKVFTVAR